jgi:hypothetical protein
LSVTLPLSGKLFSFDFECGYAHFNSPLKFYFPHFCWTLPFFILISWHISLMKHKM